VTLILTGILLVVSSIYTGIFDRITEDTGNFARFFKGIGIVMFVFGILMLLGAAIGNSSLSQPLQGLVNSASQSSVSTPILANNNASRFEPIKGKAGLDAALAKAKQSNQIAMLDFYADWCTSCKELEHFTFQDANVIASLQSMLTLQADVTPNDAQDRGLLQKFGLFGPPAILFFTPDGKELKNYRLVGYYPPEKFLAHLDKVRSAAGV
jgi:thiol:disulfide interchange protein DsbD